MDTTTTASGGLRAAAKHSDAFERAEQRVFERYGIAPRTRMLELAEPRLRVRVLESGEGPPLLLIPGDGAIAAAWAPLLAELPDRRAIVLDRPGFGLSDGFDHRGVDLRRHATALLTSLLDALEIDALPIAGSSGGGQWSLWLALHAPERVRALAVMGTPAVCLPGYSPTPGMRVASLPGLGRLVFALPSPSAKTTGKMLAPADARILEHPEIVEAYHEAMRLPGFGATASAIFRRSFRVGGAARPEWVLSDAELARIAQPTLFAWGSREPFGDPAAARRAAAVMPHARVEIVPDAWHHPWLADAGAVGRMVRDLLREASA